MQVDGAPYRTIWKKEGREVVEVIDQRVLPHKFTTVNLINVDQVAEAIRTMIVRGAPLIGVTAAYGMHFATLEAPQNQNYDKYIINSFEKLKNTRPTAVNLLWALQKQMSVIKEAENYKEKSQATLKMADHIAEEDVELCRQIGEHGLQIITDISKRKEGNTVNILTHCNAGWLACVDWGTATSPIYQAFRSGIKLHVWVDETRPRNQGANLTAWELGKHGIPHTVIVDNVGGHLMQHDMVDLVITGSDRTTRQGDVANKIGTYLKALAARDNNIPFYVALPSSTIDWEMRDGCKEIPIEKRSQDEVKYIQGWCNGEIKTVLLTPEQSPAINYGFDVTPARLITGIITERGICKANEQDLLRLFPEKVSN